ncbi:MAG: translation initiation factor IF-2 subunit beta [archaeon]
MTDYDYNSLLKRAKEQLPVTVLKQERLEMPKLNVMIMGNRTMIKNLTEAAGVIRREPGHLLKYLAKELATQGGMEGQTGVFQGKFGGFMVNKKFEKYVEEYVLCSECSKPDTNLLKKGRLVFIKCEACGAEKPVRSVR